MLLRTASRRVHRTPIASWLSGHLQQQRADLSSTPLDERQLQLEEKKLAEAAAQREHEAAQRKHEEKKLAMQRELEEKKLATQRELEEKKLVETAAQREQQLTTESHSPSLIWRILSCVLGVYIEFPCVLIAEWVVRQ